LRSCKPCLNKSPAKRAVKARVAHEKQGSVRPLRFDGTEPTCKKLPVVARPAWEKLVWPFCAHALPERKSA
jgi:hypothetical protein